jgi:hypothetical protein
LLLIFAECSASTISLHFCAEGKKMPNYTNSGLYFKEASTNACGDKLSPKSITFQPEDLKIALIIDFPNE